jgi:hypothetical protein
MAWPFAKIVLKARVSGVAFALALQAMQGEFDSLAAWTARGERQIKSNIVVAGILDGGVLLMLSREHAACFHSLL